MRKQKSEVSMKLPSQGTIAQDAPLLSIAKVAERLGICKAQVYRLFHDGLPWVQVGGIRRVNQEDLAEYIRQNTHSEVD